MISVQYFECYCIYIGGRFFGDTLYYSFIYDCFCYFVLFTLVLILVFQLLCIVSPSVALNSLLRAIINLIVTVVAKYY